MINDTLGHDAGDELLGVIADRLRSSVRKGDIVARQGGDEFTLLIKNITQTDDIVSLVDRMMAELSQSYNIKGQEFFTTPSIGISYYTKGDETALSLMKQADLAMYASKKNGKNQYTFYEQKLEQTSANQLWVESDLHHAIKNREFVLHYQPQIDSSNQKIYGVEALIRWQHPELGLLAPSHFINIAEETNLILPIGEWVLREACKQGKKWDDQGNPLKISVNISPRQFQSPDLVKMIADIIKKSGCDPKLLILEITEAVAMNNIEKTIDKLTQIKEMGVRISIDDFGTGHSSCPI
nr:bifunctional diguanylate cyclase/phosphodiesterase [Halalkalibacter alkalisediminis]